MRQDEIAWDQAQTEGNEILAEYPTQNLDRREKKCYKDTDVDMKLLDGVETEDTPIYMSISANRPPKYEATVPTTDEVTYAVPQIATFQLDL